MRRTCRTLWGIRTVVAAVLAAVALVLGGLSVVESPAAAYPGAPWFEPGKPYSANFPDPSVIEVGGTYYAYATVTGGSYVPVMTSTDLQTWVAREAYAPYVNDGLPNPASWGLAEGSDPLNKDVHAPGVAQIGGQFVMYYTVGVAHSASIASSDGWRRCISVATSTSPLGPFVDNSTGPVVCDADPGGSIDPQPFVDPSTGTAYLLWKSEGVPGSQPTRIWGRQLDAAGTGFAAGSQPTVLAFTDQGWEGNLIENPSMVRYQGQLYLFYSGNDWESANYAMGSARCSTPLGPCEKSWSNPLLASRDGQLGPGGSSAFIDAQGRLQLAYHWWNAPYSSYPAYPGCAATSTCTSQGQRRLGIVELHPTWYGFEAGGDPPPFGGDLAVDVASTPSGQGYVIAGAFGRVNSYGDAPAVGSMAGATLNSLIVDAAMTPSGDGYWLLGGDGGVFSFGDAAFYGSTGSIRLNQPVVGMAATPSGRGYWFVAADGGVFSFGDAAFYGSTGSIRLNQPVVGMAATPSGRGYWLVASDGGIFAFGDAAFYGSTGSLALNRPVVAMSASPSGSGYWFVASDGGIFAFGDAAFYGSTGGLVLNQPVTGMATSPAGTGYWLVASDGGIFAFGGVGFFGSQ